MDRHERFGSATRVIQVGFWVNAGLMTMKLLAGHFGRSEGVEHMIKAEEKASLRDKKYRDALARNLLYARTKGTDATFRKHKLEAIIVPSGGPAWTIDLVNGDSSNWDMESTSPAAVAGYPHITVPAGHVFGLPIGLSFFGKAWQEAALIKVAYAFEQATQLRRMPRFLPSANLNP